jgi:hypothetical protein
VPSRSVQRASFAPLQSGADLGVREAAHDETRDLDLAWRQRLDGVGPAVLGQVGEPAQQPHRDRGADERNAPLRSAVCT